MTGIFLMKAVRVFFAEGSTDHVVMMIDSRKSEEQQLQFKARLNLLSMCIVLEHTDLYLYCLTCLLF